MSEPTQNAGSQKDDEVKNNASAYGLWWLGLGIPYLLECEMFYFPSIAWPRFLWVLQSPYWGFLLVCIFMALFSCRLPRDSRVLRAFDGASGIFAIVAVLLVHTRVLGSSPLVVLLGLSLCGGAAAWQYIRWGECLASIGLRRAVSHICLSFMLAAVLKGVLYGLPAVRPAIDIVFSVVSVVSLRRCLTVTGGSRPKVDAVSKESFRLSDVWLIPVAVVFLSASIGVMYAARHNTFGGSGGSQMLFGDLLEASTAAAIWLWVCVRKRSLDVVGIMAIMTAAVATSCVLLATLGSAAASSAYFITCINYGLLNLFLWMLLTALSSRLAKDPRLVFAVGWILRSAPALVGQSVAKATHLELGATTCSILMYVACVVLVAVIFGRNVSIVSVFSPLSAELPKDGVNLAQRCRELAEIYRLTARESEVLELLAGGRTRPYIAESLSISENTVRVYTAKIYSKLNIHDRSSLFMLVYGFPEGDGPVQ